MNKEEIALNLVKIYQDGLMNNSSHLNENGVTTLYKRYLEELSKNQYLKIVEIINRGGNMIKNYKEIEKVINNDL